MTPAARATALLLAVAAFGVAFVVCAAVARLVARGSAPRPVVSRPRHVKACRHRAVARSEWCVWTVSVLIRWYRWEDGAPKSGVLFAGLFLAFSVLIGADR